MYDPIGIPEDSREGDYRMLGLKSPATLELPDNFPNDARKLMLFRDGRLRRASGKVGGYFEISGTTLRFTQPFEPGGGVQITAFDPFRSLVYTFTNVEGWTLAEDTAEEV